MFALPGGHDAKAPQVGRKNVFSQVEPTPHRPAAGATDGPPKAGGGTAGPDPDGRRYSDRPGHRPARPHCPSRPALQRQRYDGGRELHQHLQAGPPVPRLFVGVLLPHVGGPQDPQLGIRKQLPHGGLRAQPPGGKPVRGLRDFPEEAKTLQLEGPAPAAGRVQKVIVTGPRKVTWTFSRLRLGTSTNLPSNRNSFFFRS